MHKDAHIYICIIKAFVISVIIRDLMVSLFGVDCIA